jgi:hypothetical protein
MKASSSLGESFAGVADVKQVVFDSIHSLAIRGEGREKCFPILLGAQRSSEPWSSTMALMKNGLRVGVS